MGARSRFPPAMVTRESLGLKQIWLFFSSATNSKLYRANEVSRRGVPCSGRFGVESPCSQITFLATEPPMNRLRSIARTGIRWGWFFLLVLVAFGYLASGLSEPPEQRVAVDANAASLSKISQPSIEKTLARIDQAWKESLAGRDMKPAPQADWLIACRRMSLAMVGSGLSLEEIRRLEQIPEEDRQQAHLNALLNDPRFHHYWAERWSRFLVGTDGGQFIVYRRRRFRIWFSEVLAANRPYDKIVRDLITAEGLWTDRPEVNFLTATFDSNDGKPDPIRLAARTSRAFLGLRIDCLQCHDDFLGNVSLGDLDEPREGKQTDFHQLAAFFTSAKTSGLQGVRDGEVDYQYKYLDDEEESTVEADVPFLKELLPEDGEPRERLAQWITHPENRQASRAAVSHAWALLYGRSAGEAVDNLPLDEEVNPVLDILAEDFVANGYDLRRLISLIVMSGSFQVDSRADFAVTKKHEDAGAVFPLVRLRPEQVAGSIIQAARIKKTDRESSVFLQLQTLAGTNDFITSYGDVGEDEFTTDSVTITQRLLMMNGNMLRELINANPVFNTTAHVNMFARDDGHIVDTVYLSALNRYPSVKEKEHFVGRIGEAVNREDAVEDLFWVLLNSSELAWNH